MAKWRTMRHGRTANYNTQFDWLNGGVAGIGEYHIDPEILAIVESLAPPDFEYPPMGSFWALMKQRRQRRQIEDDES